MPTIKKRRTSLTVETHRVVAVKRAGLTVGWCATCARAVEMRPPEWAATHAQVTARWVYQRIESGEVHYEQRPGGQVVICLPSLERRLRDCRASS